MKLTDSKSKDLTNNIKQYSFASLSGFLVLGLAALIRFVPTTHLLIQLAGIPAVIGAGILVYCGEKIYKNAKLLKEHKAELENEKTELSATQQESAEKVSVIEEAPVQSSKHTTKRQTFKAKVNKILDKKRPADQNEIIELPSQEEK